MPNNNVINNEEIPCNDINNQNTIFIIDPNLDLDFNCSKHEKQVDLNNVCDSHVSEKSKIGSGVSIGQNVYIANNVLIGKRGF